MSFQFGERKTPHPRAIKKSAAKSPTITGRLNLSYPETTDNAANATGSVTAEGLARRLAAKQTTTHHRYFPALGRKILEEKHD